ncbi:Potassium channel, partial [Coemansia spiralis]
DRLRAAYRDLRRSTSKELDHHLQLRITGHREQLERLHRRRLGYFAILFTVGVLLKVCSWVLASIIFTRTEGGWSYWDSMVFVFFTLLTVGMQGRVPESPTGMVLYHTYTYLDIMCTAALDMMLLHIVWNLVPWPRVQAAVMVCVMRIRARLVRRRRPHEGPASPPPEPSSPTSTAAPSRGSPGFKAFAIEQATDNLEDAANAAARLRALLVHKAATEDELREFDRLLQAVEDRIIDIQLSEKPVHTK